MIVIKTRYQTFLNKHFYNYKSISLWYCIIFLDLIHILLPTIQLLLHYLLFSRIIAAGKSVTPLDNVDLLAPITKPDKVVCIGLNYRGHCDEQSLPYPKEPMFFNKFPSCIVGPYDNVVIPPITDVSIL